jgi:flavorubredoxin
MRLAGELPRPRRIIAALFRIGQRDRARSLPSGGNPVVREDAQAQGRDRYKEEEVAVETTVDEIGPDIYRLSTYIPEADFMFNQFLINAEEPLLFHTGLRSLFPLVSAAVARVRPVDQLRWITFGHVEADECGSMNMWLGASPTAQIAHGALGCQVSVNDLADRPPRSLQDGEVIDLGGKLVRRIETPHVPHGWDAGLLYEETTGTLFCGDLFTAGGAAPALTEHDITGPALAAEDVFGATCLTPATGATMRSLAALHPTTLGVMHGPSYAGDCAQALHDLAAAYDERLAVEGARMALPHAPGPVDPHYWCVAELAWWSW